MTLTIVHIANIDLNKRSGMGRVAFHWREAFEEAGHKFMHIGKKEVPVNHPAHFSQKASSYFKQELKGKADIILTHEPESGAFLSYGIPVVLFSHGIEAREWKLRNTKFKLFYEPVSLRSKILFPLWRLRGCNKGLKKAAMLLLSNSEDRLYVMNRFKRKNEHIKIFRNGIYETYLKDKVQTDINGDSCVIGFNGTWIKRKGIDLIVKAAQELKKAGMNVKWLLFGVVFTKEEVLSYFPSVLQPDIEIVSTYEATAEKALYHSIDIFLLPSFFEGQSLALLQAMAFGICCVTSACCAQLDLIEHHTNGLLFETGNSDDLTKQLMYVIEHKVEREEFGKKAQESIKDRNWAAVSREIVTTIENLV